MLLERLQRPVRGVRIVHKDAIGNGTAGCVQIVPMRQLTRQDVQRLLARFDVGSELVVTSALSQQERQAFLDVGFVEREALHLLRHNLSNIAPMPGHPTLKLRSGRRSDLNQVLTIDRGSFDDFWALDRESLIAARKATPVHRYIVATIDNRVVGYCVSGQAGTSTFLQRLGVSTEHRRGGIGSILVIDALRWAAEQGGAHMLVNTQEGNERALALYESLNFNLVEEQLKVLEWPAGRSTQEAP